MQPAWRTHDRPPGVMSGRAGPGTVGVGGDVVKLQFPPAWGYLGTHE